jgi:hypothetical protein
MVAIASVTATGWPVPGWQIVAIWMPGIHQVTAAVTTRSAGLLLSGDHVLPQITSHAGLHAGSGPDPLADCLASLEKLTTRSAGGGGAGTPVPLWRAARSRHWPHRAPSRATSRGADHPPGWRTSPRGMAARLQRFASWSEFSSFMPGASVSETQAHAASLERHGVVAARGRRPRTYRLSRGQDTPPWPTRVADARAKRQAHA